MQWRQRRGCNTGKTKEKLVFDKFFLCEYSIRFLIFFCDFMALLCILISIFYNIRRPKVNRYARVRMRKVAF